MDIATSIFDRFQNGEYRQLQFLIFNGIKDLDGLIE